MGTLGVDVVAEVAACERGETCFAPSYARRTFESTPVLETTFIDGFICSQGPVV